MTRNLTVFCAKVRSANGTTWGDAWFNAAGEACRSDGGNVFIASRTLAEAVAYAGPALCSIKQLGHIYVARPDVTEEVRDDS